MNNTQNSKIQSIEFLRMFLMVTIVFHHMFINRTWTLCTVFPKIHLYKVLQNHLAFGYNGVEGFFIISGFLLYITSLNKNTSLKSFIIKKYERLSPVIVFSIIICFIASCFGIIHFNILANLATILLINQFGICIAIGQNPLLWYTSTLFAGLLLYFILLKKRAPNYTYIILSSVAYILLIIINQGNFNHPLKNMYHIINIGFLRALGGIGLGVFLGTLYKTYEVKLHKFTPNPKIKITITIVEICSFLLTFYWLCCPHNKHCNIIFVILFTITFILFVMRKGYFTQILKSNFGGKYQYSIYVMHYIIIKFFGLIFYNKYSNIIHHYPILPILVMCIIIVIISIASYHLIERKQWLAYLKK